MAQQFDGDSNDNNDSNDGSDDLRKIEERSERFLNELPAWTDQFQRSSQRRGELIREIVEALVQGRYEEVLRGFSNLRRGDLNTLQQTGSTADAIQYFLDQERRHGASLLARPAIDPAVEREAAVEAAADIIRDCQQADAPSAEAGQREVQAPQDILSGDCSPNLYDLMVASALWLAVHELKPGYSKRFTLADDDGAPTEVDVSSEQVAEAVTRLCATPEGRGTLAIYLDKSVRNLLASALVSITTHWLVGNIQLPEPAEEGGADQQPEEAD